MQLEGRVDEDLTNEQFEQLLAELVMTSSNGSSGMLEDLEEEESSGDVDNEPGMMMMVMSHTSTIPTNAPTRPGNQRFAAMVTIPTVPSAQVISLGTPVPTKALTPWPRPRYYNTKPTRRHSYWLRPNHRASLGLRYQHM